MRSLWTAGCGVALVACGLAILTPSLSAFSPEHHTNITREVLQRITRTIDGHTLEFSPKAILEIIEATVNQDDGWLPGCLNPFGAAPTPPFADARNHFDSEQFAVASAAVRDRLNEARTELKGTERDGQRARTLLGEVLHGVQDYYAHSNWVERYGAIHDKRLGTDSFGPVGGTVATCAAPPNAGTYVANAGPTSGYWFGCLGRDDGLLPAGKCYHGLHKGTVNYAGTNKDNATESPMFFNIARQAAVNSTTAIVEALLDSPGIKGNLEATSELMGEQTIAFVVDETLSMDEELPVVKAMAQQMVDAAVAAGESPEYLLVRFKDDDNISAPFVTTDPAAFMAQVNGLVAEGGSYCPEWSVTATYVAIAASIPGSKVFTFTDATAEDGFNASAASELAKEKDIRSNRCLRAVAHRSTLH